MIYLGAHLSSAKGFYKMGWDALAIGANTFQCFIRSPRGTKAKSLDLEDIAKLRTLMRERSFGPILAHAPYTMNPCSLDKGIRDLAWRTLREDLALMEYLPGNYYNFHPGNHRGQGVEIGCRQIADMLNAVVKPEQQTAVLLETMAGKGSEIGRTFEELRMILEMAECPEKLGVCLDTCHISDGGYDLVSGLDGVLEKFDRIIGLERLKAVHINDSANLRGSHKDRHAMLGMGKLGWDPILRVITHPALAGRPFILETPTDNEGHRQELLLLREKLKELEGSSRRFSPKCQFV